MAFKKGQTRHPNAGRKKGQLNKLTATIKEEIEKVYVGLGGAESMLAWAKENPDGFYGGLLPKIIPRDLNVSTKGVVSLKVNVIIDADREPRSVDDSPPPSDPA